MLVKPGKAHTYKVTYSGIEAPDAGVAQRYVTVRLEPYRPFVPSGRLATPCYLDATMTAAEVRLR